MGSASTFESACLTGLKGASNAIYMQMAKVDFRYVDYPRAVHAFTNPEATALGKKFGLPLKYDAAADKKAKAEATKFLADVLQK